MVKIKTVLNWLAYGIALIGFIPLFVYLEPVPRLLFVAALGGTVFMERTGRSVKGWIPTAVSLVFFVFYAVRFNRHDVVGPAVNLLVILLAIRLFSEKSPRHYLQIYALGLFCLAASSLFSLSPWFLCYFLLMLMMIAVSLVMLTYHTSTSSAAVPVQRLKTILKVALVMPVASLPLILLFFFILPRTQFPLWNFLNSGGVKVTGFTERVSPGASPSVSDVKNVAFRAAVKKLPPEQLYWRGMVYNVFEGNAWIRRQPPFRESGVPGRGEVVTQTIFPEPGRAGALLTLNIPRKLSGVRSTVSPDSIYVRSSAPSGHQKYEVVSVLSGRIAARGVDTGFYLAIPPRLSPRIVKTAAAVAAKADNDPEKIELLKQFFLSQKFTYATTALPTGADPLDQFLFEKKRGHCEFFASSFALMLRAAGIPSRLVGGYYGGTYNDFGGYYVVTDDMAHVWVEAFLPGEGWITVDPSSWAADFSGNRDRKRGVMETITLSLDALEYYWNLVVINYDLERQLLLLSRANFEVKRMRIPDLKGWLWLAAVPLVILFGCIWLRRRAMVSVEERILGRFFRKVKHEYGVERVPSTGLLHLASCLDDPDVMKFAALYSGIAYRDRALTREDVQSLQQYTRQIRNRHPGRLHTSL